MGFCCGNDVDGNKPFEKNSDQDLSCGPVKSRRCTDILCVPIFLTAQLIWLIVTLAGVVDGDPTKLYKPRDYQGAYCGVKSNWNSGPNTEKQTKLSYTMNVSSVTDIIMQQTICSSYASSVLSTLLNSSQLDSYHCDCCHVPCTRCQGATYKGGDLASGADVQAVIAARMSELTDPSKAQSLFTPGGSNGAMFSTNAFWEQATKYFNQVCMPECSSASLTGNETENDTRVFTYMPSMDSVFYFEWQRVLLAAETPLTRPLQKAMASAFEFTALPEDVCPYPPEVCVPFPGIHVKEATAGSNYCTFEMATNVMNAVGATAAGAFSALGMDTFTAATPETFGKWVGDYQESIDTFIVVSVLSFVLSLVFIVLLRLFIGVCVWLAVLLTIFMFFFGAAFLFVLSGQCQGVTVWETGKQNAVAVVVAGTMVVSDAIKGTQAPSEGLTGDGSDYRGRQQISRYGKKCLRWDDQEVWPDYNSTNYAVLSPVDSTKNYCRNPYNNESDALQAKTIWCITADPNVHWEECLPIGVIQPDCPTGYTIEGRNMREALKWSAVAVWIMGGIWVIVIICFVGRIRLAIALNKVAAEYIACNPSTVLVPVVQAVLGIGWVIAWLFGISFLLSQVPDTYTPNGYYATYAEAFGTANPCPVWETGDHCKAQPGICTNKFPVGSVWKDTECEEGSDGVARCWRCAPPRYVIDERFAISFFVFLWNNAFNVALGQMLIAMAVSLWFFTVEKRKTWVLKRAVKTIFRYHLGTVAFGSFIIAVIQFIRYLMMYFEKQAAAQKNRVMVLVLKCVQCCIWCFEKCVKFLNKNAYIQTALMGTSFCTSAKKAFFLILRNVLRFGTMAVLGSVVHAIGFVFIMVGTLVMGYFLMRAMHPDVSPFLPMILYLFISYIMAGLFMGTFGLAVDTCVQCFLACEEMGECGEYVPGVLQQFVSAHANKDRKTAWKNQSD